MDLQPRTPQPSDPEAMLRRELLAGERVLWSGRPRGWGLGNFRIWLFAIPWTAFALFWMAMAGFLGAAGSDPFGSYFWMFGIPFVLVGLAMLARPLFAIGREARTLFAVTDRRLIRLRTGRRLQLEAVPVDRILSVEAEEKRDGTGTLRLLVERGSAGAAGTHFAMQGIPDVARVRRLISERQH